MDDDAVDVANNNSSNNNETSTDDEFVEANDSEIIRSSLRLYGSIYVAIFFTFCFVRIRFPRLYNLRSWVDQSSSSSPSSSSGDSGSRLANSMAQKYTFLSWAWIVFQVDDDQLLRNCGMDAVAFLRCLRLGAKLSAVGMFNAIYLIPVYYTAGDVIEDKFVRMTAGNLPIGSIRFPAIVVATYIVVLASLYLVTKEYKWYAKMRHKFLSLDQERNYAIYVSGIPEEFRSDFALGDFFGADNGSSCSGDGNGSADFVAANVAMDIPKLEAKVEKRRRLVERLEHAIAEERIKGIVKKHRTFKLQNAAAKKMPLSESVESVQTYRKHLDELNTEIATEVGRIRNRNHRLRRHLSKSNASNDLLRGRALTLEECELPSSINEIEDIDETSEEVEEKYPHQVVNNDLDGPNNNIEPRSSSTELSTSDDNDDEDEVEDVHATTKNLAGDLTTTGMLEVPDVEMGTIDEFSTCHPPEESKTEADPSVVPDFMEYAPNFMSYDSSESELNDWRDKSNSSIEFQGPQATTNLPTPSEISETDIDASDRNVARKENTDTNEKLSSSFGNLALSNPLSSLTKRASLPVQRAASSLTKRTSSLAPSVDTISGGVKKAKDLSLYGTKKVRDIGMSGAQLAVDGAKTTAIEGIKRAQTQFVENAAAIAPILRSKGEGAPRDAGFVVFDGLYLTQAALQMLQHPDGTKMLVEEAPAPDQIFWRNVGLPASSKRTGGILALVATATLCLFWSIPVAFISSLTSVNSLKETLPRLGTLMERYPALEQLVAVLAPLFLLALNEGILPIILKYFSTWEGHISSPRLEASLFKKLAAFAIIQTFFVSTVSGSITSELANMIDDPENIVRFLGTSLPAQSSYFIQIVFVFTFFVQGLELLRVTPLSFAFLRRFVGPRLTKKERKRKWHFIYSLEDPPPFHMADFFAQIVLFYVILFVYSSTSPITCVFLFGCFLINEMGYRYHFIHNFKTEADSGGRIWTGFINLLLSSVIIGQLTLIGLLLLNQAFYSVPALAPLLIITILYWASVQPKRMRVASRLPAVQAKEVDRARRIAAESSSTFNKLKDVYMQPTLQQPILLPDTDDDD
mmetsp:Transcript_12969/g.31598  ORF Transcript_12969/g.31598 Transcript_12969/m.31598 type:complete len:1086 (-) Transcript_12969:153-3410(-)